MPTNATSQVAVRSRTTQVESELGHSVDQSGLLDPRRYPRFPLLGREPRYFRHAERSAASLLELVQSYSVDGRATGKMIAWTEGWAGHGDDEDPLGAPEAYLVLGWTSTAILRGTLSRRLDALNPVAAFRLLDQPEIAVLERSHRNYVVLRGLAHRNAGTMGLAAGAISAHDIDFWHTTRMGEVDGMFAIDVDTFRDRFVATGVAA